jgi:hypothetical protein
MAAYGYAVLLHAAQCCCWCLCAQVPHSIPEPPCIRPSETDGAKKGFRSQQKKCDNLLLYFRLCTTGFSCPPVSLYGKPGMAVTTRPFASMQSQWRKKCCTAGNSECRKEVLSAWRVCLRTHPAQCTEHHLPKEHEKSRC